MGPNSLRRSGLDSSQRKGFDGRVVEGTWRLLHQSGLYGLAIEGTPMVEIFSSPSSNTQESDIGKLAMEIWISNADLGCRGWVGLLRWRCGFPPLAAWMGLRELWCQLGSCKSEANWRLLSLGLATVASSGGCYRCRTGKGCRWLLSASKGGGVVGEGGLSIGMG